MKRHDSYLYECTIWNKLFYVYIRSLKTIKKMSGNKIYVGNLKYSISEEQLTEVFSKYGQVNECRIPTSKKRKLGYGFIEFSNSEEAQKSLEMDGKEIEGREVKVSISTGERKDNSKGSDKNRDETRGYNSNNYRDKEGRSERRGYGGGRFSKK